MNKYTQFIKKLENQLINPVTDLTDLTPEQQFELIKSKVAIHPEAIIPKPNSDENELLDLLRVSKETGKPLHIKFGIDPTGPNIHLGHSISLLMLRRFQWMGHHIDLVVGDATARIGDPSGRSAERDILSDESIKNNMSTYISQASKIINLDKNKDVKVWFNSTWLSTMTIIKEWLPILQKIGGNRLLEREDFTKRLKKGTMVSAAEMLYPMFMSYDSVVIKPDIELGGVDQLLNLHWCRELMKLSNQKSEVFLLVDLLPGTSGEVDETNQLIKMSKSKNNYIMVSEIPVEMYGKVMSIPDKVMWIWYRELTEISNLDLDQLQKMVDNNELHPMDAKKLLAQTIVGTFNHYNKDIIISAEKAFSQKFGKDKILVSNDTVLINAKPGTKIIDLIMKATNESKGNLKKMTSQIPSSGIKILVEDKYVNLTTKDLISQKLTKGKELLVKIGKRKSFKFISKS